MKYKTTYVYGLVMYYTAYLETKTRFVAKKMSSFTLLVLIILKHQYQWTKIVSHYS